MKDGKKVEPKDDMVNSPPHYNKAGIECIDAIAAALGDGYEHYLQGNIMKYLWRYRYKNGTEDLKKAQWYLTKLIEEVEVSTTMRVRIYITVDVDPEEYPVPADEDVGTELEDGIREYFYDIDGAEIRNMKTLTGVRT